MAGLLRVLLQVDARCLFIGRVAAAAAAAGDDGDDGM